MNSNSVPHLVVGLVVLSAVAGGMMFVHNYWKKFAEAVQPKAQEPARPLAEAAPVTVQNRDAFRALANQARFAIGQCQKKSAYFKKPIGQGKVVVWDLSEGDLSEVLSRVPAELRATTADGTMTMLLIGKQEEVPLEFYYHKQFATTPLPIFSAGKSDVQGYRVDTEVCVVGMPGARPLGRFTVEGDHPPSTLKHLKLGQRKVVGDWTPAVAKFAELCVKGEPGPAPPQIVPKGKETLIALVNQAKGAVEFCERKTSGQWVKNLPQQAVVWSYRPEYQIDNYHGVNWKLPKEVQADGNSSELVVFFHIESQTREPRDRNDRKRYDLVMAAVMLPGPRPLGKFVIPDEPESIPKEYRPKYGPPDSDFAYAYWIRRFLESQGEWVGK
jgi:hypothetical protein